MRFLLLENERWSEVKNFVGDIGWLTIPDHPELADVKLKLLSHGKAARSSEIVYLSKLIINQLISKL